MAEYIEREALYKRLFTTPEGKRVRFRDCDNFPITITVEELHKIILKFPAVKVAEVRHGKWDRNHNCSVCGVYKFKGLDADIWADWNIDYCPNCGAKMDLEV